MAWQKVIPENTGGGRKRNTPSARYSADGQLVLNHATAELIGNSNRVLLDVDFERQAMRLRPTTPGDAGGFALSGGGNAQYRLTCKSIAKRKPGMIGEYTIRKCAGGIELIKRSDEGELEL